MGVSTVTDFDSTIPDVKDRLEDKRIAGDQGLTNEMRKHLVKMIVK